MSFAGFLQGFAVYPTGQPSVLQIGQRILPVKSQRGGVKPGDHHLQIVIYCFQGSPGIPNIPE